MGEDVNSSTVNTSASDAKNPQSSNALEESAATLSTGTNSAEQEETPRELGERPSSVKQLSAWLSDDAFKKKTTSHASTSASIPVPNSPGSAASSESSEVKVSDKKKWLQEAFKKSPTAAPPVLPSCTKSGAGPPPVPSMPVGVSDKTKWLQNAFKKKDGVVDHKKPTTASASNTSTSTAAAAAEKKKVVIKPDAKATTPGKRVMDTVTVKVPEKKQWLNQVFKKKDGEGIVEKKLVPMPMTEPAVEDAKSKGKDEEDGQVLGAGEEAGEGEGSKAVQSHVKKETAVEDRPQEEPAIATTTPETKDTPDATVQPDESSRTEELQEPSQKEEESLSKLDTPKQDNSVIKDTDSAPKETQKEEEEEEETANEAPVDSSPIMEPNATVNQPESSTTVRETPLAETPTPSLEEEQETEEQQKTTTAVPPALTSIQSKETQILAVSLKAEAPQESMAKEIQTETRAESNEKKEVAVSLPDAKAAVVTVAKAEVVAVSKEATASATAKVTATAPATATETTAASNPVPTLSKPLEVPTPTEVKVPVEIEAAAAVEKEENKPVPPSTTKAEVTSASPPTREDTPVQSSLQNKSTDTPIETSTTTIPAKVIPSPTEPKEEATPPPAAMTNTIILPTPATDKPPLAPTPTPTPKTPNPIPTKVHVQMHTLSPLTPGDKHHTNSNGTNATGSTLQYLQTIGVLGTEFDMTSLDASSLDMLQKSYTPTPKKASLTGSTKKKKKKVFTTPTPVKQQEIAERGATTDGAVVARKLHLDSANESLDGTFATAKSASAGASGRRPKKTKLALVKEKDSSNDASLKGRDLLLEGNGDVLTPLQEQIFMMMERQQEALERLERKVDALTEMVRGGGPTSIKEEYARGDEKIKAFLHPPTTAARRSKGATQEPPPVVAPQPPANPIVGLFYFCHSCIMAFLKFVTSFFRAILTALRQSTQSVHQTLSRTKIYRIISASYREARRQNVHGQFDVWLMVKLLAVVAIFGGRASSRRRRGGDDASLEWLAQYRLYVLCATAVVAYILQTGLLGFFVRLVRDLPRLLEEDERRERERRRREEDVEGEADGSGGAAAAQTDPAEGEQDGVARDGAQPQAQPQAPQQAPRDAPNGPPPPPGAGARGRTFAEGMVMRRGGGILADVKYFFGAFFLSLIPTWWPVPEPAVEETEEGEEGGEGDGMPPPPAAAAEDEEPPALE